MPRKKRTKPKNKKKTRLIKYEPSPKEIKDELAEIRKGWDLTRYIAAGATIYDAERELGIQIEKHPTTIDIRHRVSTIPID